MRLICNICELEFVADNETTQKCPKCNSPDLKLLNDPTWLGRVKTWFKTSIFSMPYTGVEISNWILKHIHIYLSRSLAILIILLFITNFSFLPPIWYSIILLAVIALMLVVGHYISKVFYKRTYKIDIFGKLKKNWFEGTLNNISEPKYWVGFVGDIMRMKKYKLIFSTDIIEFFRGTKLIIGNLEGIIAPKKSGIASQNHRNDIFDNLLEFNGNNSRLLLLSMSNNHSGDFGWLRFNETKEQAMKYQFEVFGYRERPNFPDKEFLNSKKSTNGFLEFLDKINIVTGTMWRTRNKLCDYISLYEWKNKYHNNLKFNILYPHWHYEHEDFLRKRIHAESIDLLKCGDDPYEEKPWDLIFGHHTHVPQAITEIKSEDPGIPNKLLAFSGGNFFSGDWRHKHNHGLVMKCEIGKWNNDKYAVGKVEWSYTKNKFRRWSLSRKNHVKTVIIDQNQNKKRSFFIVRKRILYSLYISFFIVPVLLFILFVCNFRIDVIRFFLNLAIFQIGLLGYILITFHRRR
jgi:hypothetical protein